MFHSIQSTIKCFLTLFNSHLPIPTCLSLWSRRGLIAVVLLWLSAAAAAFVKFAPLAYGFVPLSRSQVKELQWKDTWDLIVHKP